MAGLHDIAPIVPNRCVTRATSAPMRAAPAAASQPACPPPTTMTSNVVFMALLLALLSNGVKKTYDEVFHVKRGDRPPCVHVKRGGSSLEKYGYSLATRPKASSAA